MLSTVPVDDAIRTLSTEMSKDKDASFIGKTESEMEILAHYANMGRRRAALGAIFGSTVMAGFWKLSRNQKRAAGAFAMMSGGLFGASLMEKIPDNPFVQELNQKFKHSAAATDSWNEEANEPASFGAKPATSLPPVPRYDNGISSSIPPITGLDTPRHKKDSSDGDQEAFGEPNDSGSRSPFFFGAKPPNSDESEFGDRDAPLSRDPYAHYSRDTRRAGTDKNVPALRHDEDDYFFGVPSEDDAPAKPTTWEEIRRRAAERK
ncbi:hypothetical protein AM588_10004087 [Phytophthora nicotianae]|uniref:Uncharacterized protein n=1 Tax=Phytophthora nicotianae TaxID=4792 RepID=A0A0W8DAI5_PHYNI|nr:hypothetical protein AM588_10004087 [Phytophthora nicotianae]